MSILGLDHLVLTVGSIEATCAFYCNALGMERVTFGEGRTALAFGDQKINLHQVDRTFEPKAKTPTPGSADMCFLVDSLATTIVQLGAKDANIIEGPVERTGARGRLQSIYLRDPDGNLIELSELMEPQA